MCAPKKWHLVDRPVPKTLPISSFWRSYLFDDLTKTEPPLTYHRGLPSALSHIFGTREPNFATLVFHQKALMSNNQLVLIVHQLRSFEKRHFLQTVI